MEDKAKKEFCEHHIEKLSQKLAEIFTIKVVETVDNGKKEKNINLLEEISKLEFLEGIYSTIEKEGVSEGEIFEEYNAYLNYVRKKLKEYKEIKDDINRNNAVEINNINILLSAFKSKLSF